MSRIAREFLKAAQLNEAEQRRVVDAYLKVHAAELIRAFLPFARQAGPHRPFTATIARIDPASGLRRSYRLAITADARTWSAAFIYDGRVAQPHLVGHGIRQLIEFFAGARPVGDRELVHLIGLAAMRTALERATAKAVRPARRPALRLIKNAAQPAWRPTSPVRLRKPRPTAMAVVAGALAAVFKPSGPPPDPGALI